MVLFLFSWLRRDGGEARCNAEERHERNASMALSSRGKRGICWLLYSECLLMTRTFTECTPQIPPLSNVKGTSINPLSNEIDPGEVAVFSSP